MNAFDFSPLFRSTIGFDRLMQLADAATQSDGGYPPYNIEVTGDNTYRLTMAVAGFKPEELDVTAKEGTLVVAGKAKTEGEQPRSLYRGIARRAFERRFQLAEHVEVKSAKLENGLLHVELEQIVPEEKKPRRIAINAPELKTIEGTAKAA
jgi:molecular chaperone IbpA